MATKLPRCPSCGRQITPGREHVVKAKDGSRTEICHRKPCRRAAGLGTGRSAASYPGYWPSSATT